MKTRWILPLVAVVVLAIASIAVASRSGDDKKVTKGTDLSAVKCPLEPTGESVGGVARSEPATDALDTAELVGLKLADAKSKAASKRCDIVVSIKDGAGQQVPIELNPKLIYVYTEKDIVTQIEGVGGGI